ncbi:MAG: lactonase family protein [Candidatus Sulfotelmatobacter sp.]
MCKYALDSPVISGCLLALCLSLIGCNGESTKISGLCPATGTCCGGAPGSNIVCSNNVPLLYATTRSNQILPFSISSSGALTALTPATGPADSESVTGAFGLLFADQSSDAVYSYMVNGATGALTPVPGSPFSLGAPEGGPTSIMVGPYAYLYATEPNGTIVGYGTTSQVNALGAPLPGSPYAAGIAPSQMDFAADDDTGVFYLYASDPGDPNGGVLGYSLDSTGSLTPIPGSPFPTVPNAQPTVVRYGAFYQSLGSPVGSFLFVSLTAAAKIAVFSIDTSTGILTAVPGSPFAVGDGPGMLVEDDFNHLYVMNGIDHTVSAFNVGSNGVLSAIGSPVPAGTADGGMAYFPWNQLYVADTASSAIVIFNLDQSTGVLTPAGPPFAATSPPLQLAYVGP